MQRSGRVGRAHQSGANFVTVQHRQQTTHVVGVKMSRHHQVQAAVPGGQHTGHGARRAFRVGATVNQRLTPIGRDNQRTVPLAHVKEVDVQALVRPGPDLPQQRNGGRRHQQRNSGQRKGRPSGPQR